MKFLIPLARLNLDLWGRADMQCAAHPVRAGPASASQVVTQSGGVPALSKVTNGIEGLRLELEVRLGSGASRPNVAKEVHGGARTRRVERRAICIQC